MKLPKYLTLNKQVGETPLEVLDEFKKNNHTYAAVPMAYAGRLDPLASGKLLVLVGDECKRADKYHNLDKEYTFEVLLGFSTDSQDLLGMAEVDEVLPQVSPTSEAIQDVASRLSGKQTFAYPAFSSKTVEGKPLFSWALEDRIDEIQIPTKDVHIYKLEHVLTRTVSKQELFSYITNKIESIKPVTEHTKALGNDFRRPDIRATYAEIQHHIKENQKFYILEFTCICSSGTYMRTLAHKIARELGYKGLASAIHRTNMGSYSKMGPFSFWSQKY